MRCINTSTRVPVGLFFVGGVVVFNLFLDDFIEGAWGALKGGWESPRPGGDGGGGVGVFRLRVFCFSPGVVGALCGAGWGFGASGVQFGGDKGCS